MDINEYISSGIIEMYVMGLCNAAEKHELESLRHQHPVLNKAIVAYEKELEERMQKDIKLPAQDTDDKILQSLNALLVPVVSIDAGKKTGNRFSWGSVVAAASVLLLLVSAYFNYSLFTKTKTQEQALSKAKENKSIATLPLADYKVMNDPAITPVAMYGVGYHAICRCTMFWDKKTGKIYIMIHHLPGSSTTRDYQLWANVNGKSVNVGIINDSIRGRFIEMQHVPVEATSFIVTLEQAGGVDTPTIEETYLSGKI